MKLNINHSIDGNHKYIFAVFIQANTVRPYDWIFIFGG